MLATIVHLIHKSDIITSMDENISALYKLISEAKYAVAFTGAGVSTLSGIRDFRGKNGLYNEFDAEKIFSLEYFFRDPSFYYSHSKDFIYGLEQKEPSIVHSVLGRLESKGLLKALITQNVDLLHTKGGSKRVIEIHGSPQAHYCPKCQNAFNAEKAVLTGKVKEQGFMEFDEAAAIVQKGEMPRCKDCGETLKPAITFFGESLPVQALAAAEQEAAAADLMLVLGTSLTVFPAAGFPQITLRNGGNIIIVNNMETHLDKYAELCFDDLKTVFEGLAELIDT